MALFDSYLLGSTGAFQNRVQSALMSVCTAIASEGGAVANHAQRLQTVHTVLSSQPNTQDAVWRFSYLASVDPTCVSQANQNGTVPLTQANASTQEALVTDAAISNAVSAAFNAVVAGIQI